MDLQTIATRLVRLGENIGADEIEVYIEDVVTRSVSLMRGIEALGSNHFSGLGVRVIDDRRTGLSSSTFVDGEESKRVVRRACSIAKIGQTDKEWVSLARDIKKANVRGIFDPEIQYLSPEVMSSAAQDAIETVREQNSNLSVTRGSILTGIRTTVVANNHCPALERRESFASATISVKAGEGDARGLGSESAESHTWKSLDITGACLKASNRAVAATHAKALPPCTTSVIWRNKLFANVLSIMFAGTLSAESVQKKRSPWVGKVGSKIAAENLTLVDNGLLAGGLGTREFDDEGVPQERVALIEKGILQGYLYDTFTANKDQVESTGNASRSYDNTPHPTPNNLVLAPSQSDFDEIIQETKHGIYLEELIGTWLSSPISGYLSSGVANGTLVEKGELAQPVKGVLVSGNFFEILQGGIDLLGKDVDYAGGSYSPTVRFASMSVTPQ